MTTTKDKLEFALAMGRHTRASLRQVQALMRYAGTLRTLSQSTTDSISPGQDRIAARRWHIQRKVWFVCDELRELRCPCCGAERDGMGVLSHFRGCADAKAGIVLQPTPVFAGAVLKIRSNSFGDEGIVVPS